MHSRERQVTTEQAGDAHWLAFRYVANEMSDSERDQFEERLFDDQAAREAVASAVELTQTIAGIETVEQSVQVAGGKNRRLRSWQQATWIAAAIAGCLSIVLGWQLVSQMLDFERARHSDVADRNATHHSASGELAEAWIDAADESSVILTAGSDVDDAGGSALAVALDSLSAPEESLPILEPEYFEAPDWMVAAVSGMYVDTPETSEQ